MIGYLSGQILEHSDGKMIVVMGTPGSSVGYQVNVPFSPAYGAFTIGKSIELFIHTHVREDALDLYGFSSREEKELFLTLLNVNGIGPKGALGILSKVEPTQLIEAVMNGDKDTLTSIPGIGKKTAERVVLELADPLRKKMELGMFLSKGATPVGWGTGATKSDQLSFGDTTQLFKDAKDALVELGYREQDVASLLKKVQTAKKQLQKVEEIVRMALQQLI